ncbi:hypothetical protein [Arthrobacter sp. K5]|uniref:Uncharacterized protein n=1 Tax=Arthrobacter sp. K5 TaxID=2839623 RepID=A0AAU8EXE2_9MICC
MAAEFRMTDDDRVGPAASLAEDMLELQLLTVEDNGLGAMDWADGDGSLDGSLTSRSVKAILRLPGKAGRAGTRGAGPS